MSRIGYFEFIRKYAKLNHAKPRIQDACGMWKLLAPPFFLGAVIHYICEMILSRYSLAPLAPPYILTIRAFVVSFVFTGLIPVIGFLGIYHLRLKPELVDMTDRETATLKREMLFTHLPWLSSWGVLTVPIGIYFTGICFYGVCESYLCTRIMLYVYGMIFPLCQLSGAGMAIKKARAQLPGRFMRSIPQKTQYSKPFGEREQVFKAVAICFYFMAAYCLIAPFLIVMNPGPKDSKEFPMGFFIGSMFVFSLFALGVAMIARYFWRRANQHQSIFAKLAVLPVEGFEKEAASLKDYEMCILFENLVDANDFERIAVAEREMQKRGLIGDEKIKGRDDLYIFTETGALQGGGDIRIAHHYILITPVVYTMDDFVILDSALDEAVITERKIGVTMTRLEVKFRRRAFRDKFVVHTDKLDQWLAFLEKCNVPIEDKRPSAPAQPQ